ncbi:hypothetical protein QAD02_020446 [Eretmocerus hayati]|uniref:Uncharacterized protein n=1 Tax=Eretmocerus hayati TaxID=131215 RepID=A0ACC2PMI8_9HYME|nr:hypothetical protein QAD02_020446 [Eretmocerus hayati]
MAGLRMELDRLWSNRLDTIVQQLLTFASPEEGLFIFTMNIQSLQKHSVDLSDLVTQSCEVLILTGTWLNDDANLDIDNYKLICQPEREGFRSAGLTIDIGSRVGDICATECTLRDGRSIVIVALYISPSSSINDIIELLSMSLAYYLSERTTEMRNCTERNDLSKCSLVLAGYFDVSF